MKRYLITFSYDGTDFNGYQKQPDLRTVQGEMERVLKTINNNEDVDLQASGRTDAKVHAINQKAHFDLSQKITPDKLRIALDSHIPDDIYIKSINIVDNSFHARYMVKAKEYIYKINLGEYDPLERNYVYQYNKRLDLAEIERAMKYLEGEHDFTTFSCKEELKENNVRTLIQTNLFRDKKDPNKVTLSFLGTGFLRYQVRNMVGTLIEVGEGKRKSEDMIELISKKDRRKAGITANPEGLYLQDVLY